MKPIPHALYLLTLLCVACGPSQEQACADKLSALDALRREASANVIRQQGECQAVAVEFAGNERMIASCMESLRAMVLIAQTTHADANKRLSYPDMQRCQDLRLGITPGTGPSFRER